MVKLLPRRLSGLTEQLCADGHFVSLTIKKPFPNARTNNSPHGQNGLGEMLDARTG
jgi:hypothetical protein